MAIEAAEKVQKLAAGTATLSRHAARNALGLSGGTFSLGGAGLDLAGGGVFQGAIAESDSAQGTTVGSLTEGWIGGEVASAGVGKITTVPSPLGGWFGFLGGSLSAGPLAGIQAGVVGGWDWIGVYWEGHLGMAVGGGGAYLSRGGLQ